MSITDIIFNSLIMMFFVIAYVWIGIFIGREFGSFERFVDTVIRKIRRWE